MYVGYLFMIEFENISHIILLVALRTTQKGIWSKLKMIFCIDNLMYFEWFGSYHSCLIYLKCMNYRSCNILAAQTVCRPLNLHWISTKLVAWRLTLPLDVALTRIIFKTLFSIKSFISFISVISQHFNLSLLVICSFVFDMEQKNQYLEFYCSLLSSIS